MLTFSLASPYAPSSFNGNVLFLALRGQALLSAYGLANFFFLKNKVPELFVLPLVFQCMRGA